MAILTEASDKMKLIQSLKITNAFATKERRIDNWRWLMGFLVSILLFLFLFVSPLRAATYHIGSDVSDDYASYKAFRAAHTEAAGDIVSFRKGDIFRESITIPASGTDASHPITYTSHGTGDRPSIRPTTLLTSWTPYSGKIYYASLATAPKVVMINDTYCRPAFWPSTVGNNPPVLSYPMADLGSYTQLRDSTIDFDPTGATVHLFGGLGNLWQYSVVAVTGWNNDTKTMTTNKMLARPVTTSPYYLTGLVSFMSENTWVYDSPAQRLYVWKTGGGNPGTVEAATSDHAIYGINKTCITIDGLDVRYTNSSGIYIMATVSATGNISDIIIRNCTISYTAGNAIRVAGAKKTSPETWFLASNCQIKNNTIDNSAIAYISANYEFYGIEVELNSNCGISGNTLTNTGGFYPVLPGKGSAIYTHNHHSDDCTSCLASTISSNTITNATNCGMEDSSYYTVRSGNTITNTNTMFRDGAAIIQVEGSWGNRF